MYNIKYIILNAQIGQKSNYGFVIRTLLCQNIFLILLGQGRAYGAFISALTRLLGYNATRGATEVAPHWVQPS